jgi:CheY-like chemotaxis protein
MARLVVITKGLPALPYDLNDKWITIGRADGNLFQISDPSVSGRHCEVRFTGGELIVRDLQSTNGTFVDGKNVIEATLKPGQNLRLGDVELQLEMTTTEPRPGTAFITRALATTVVAAGVTQTASSEPAKPVPTPASKPVAGSEPPVEADRKYQVLFVDDSMAFLESFTELCSLLSNDAWEIHCAPTADRALAILQQTPMDLAVLDIGMPMLDGLQLLGIISRRYPATKLAVMTGRASETKRADSLASGAELFIEKPVSPDGIKVVFNMLNDLVSWTHREGFTGALRQVNLHEVIQMECIARHSSILEIRDQKIRGQIFIETGMIIHAVAGTLIGEAAFNQLMCIPGGQFHLKPFIAPLKRTIQGGWEVLLLEAARRSDEDTVLLSKKAVEAMAAATVPPGNPRPANEAKHPAPDASQTLA